MEKNSYRSRLFAGHLLVWSRARATALALTVLPILWLASAKADVFRPTDALSRGLVGNGCAACHKIDPVMSHPLGVTPSMPVPSDLPLENGQITCLTCHQNADPASHTAARSSHTPMLRRGDAAVELCAACHTADSTGSAKSMHSAALGQAHLTPKSGIYTQSLTWRRIDQESQNCLSCHDGMLATDASLGSSGPRGGHGKDHPVGIAYRNSTQSMGVMPLAPATMLNSRIRLFDNTIGCGSCHSLYSPEDKHLVMSNLRSRLCLSCHQDR